MTATAATSGQKTQNEITASTRCRAAAQFNTMDATDRQELERILKRYGALELRLVLSELADESTQDSKDDRDEPSCSFCGKRKWEVESRIIPGPDVYICCYCVELCHMVSEREWPDLHEKFRHKPSA
jgi:hypothetical protein